MKLIPTTEIEIKNIITSFKPKNSTGYEGVTPTTLKHCMNAISKPISHICNASLNQGIYPDRLKFAIVKPIYKKGEKTSVSNYRPISLLTTFSRILEKVVYNRLSQHLYVNKIITPEKFVC
jgi:sarcosine oxidase/L-pipecolate oxidase